jgi:hypothetical protein
VLNVAAQNAVEVRYISPAVSSLQFIRQIGATLGLAVLGSIVNQELATKTAANIPAGTYAHVPPAFASQLKALENPQALFGGAPDAILAKIQDPAARQAFMNIVGVIKHAVKGALADSVHTMFLYALVVVLAAVVASLFMREIPLQKAHEWAGGSGKPPPEPLL